MDRLGLDGYDVVVQQLFFYKIACGRVSGD
jgi:hypothetical protein